jgi:hypothetical protein
LVVAWMGWWKEKREEGGKRWFVEVGDRWEGDIK